MKDESSIEDLTIKQLKEILTANFVDYKGCCEKRELIERVRRLWQDSQKNQQKGKSNKILLGVPQLKDRDGINLFFSIFIFRIILVFFSQTVEPNFFQGKTEQPYLLKNFGLTVSSILCRKKCDDKKLLLNLLAIRN